MCSRLTRSGPQRHIRQHSMLCPTQIDPATNRRVYVCGQCMQCSGVAGPRARTQGVEGDTHLARMTAVCLRVADVKSLILPY